MIYGKPIEGSSSVPLLCCSCTVLLSACLCDLSLYQISQFWLAGCASLLWYYTCRAGQATSGAMCRCLFLRFGFFWVLYNGFCVSYVCDAQSGPRHLPKDVLPDLPMHTYGTYALLHLPTLNRKIHTDGSGGPVCFSLASCPI